MSDWVDYRDAAVDDLVITASGLVVSADDLVITAFLGGRPRDQSAYLSGEWLAGPDEMSYDDVVAAFEATWRARRMPMLRWGA